MVKVKKIVAVCLYCNKPTSSIDREGVCNSCHKIDDEQIEDEEDGIVECTYCGVELYEDEADYVDGDGYSCSGCSGYCDSCQTTHHIDSIDYCDKCDTHSCREHFNCDKCGKRICEDCTISCDSCGNTFCETCISKCDKCLEKLCNKCHKEHSCEKVENEIK